MAWQEGKKFRVVVMDSRPQLEGRALLRRLLSHGIACTYVLLNAASYIMSEVTKVLRPYCYSFARPVIQYTACLPSKHQAAGVTGVLLCHLDVNCNKSTTVAALGSSLNWPSVVGYVPH